LDQELDYDEIQKVAIGSVSRPNTSFQEERGFIPLERWKRFYSSEQTAMFEELTGESLEELGYKRSTKIEKASLGMSLFRAQYRVVFDAKLYLRTKTSIGRLLVNRDLSKM
jgi:hypothetical protein